MSEKKRLVIVGGGAAGFFSAINAAQLANNLEVIILEKHINFYQRFVFPVVAGAT